MGRIVLMGTCIAALTIAGCHSLAGSIVDFKPDYTTLPEADLRAAAAEIEAAVQAGNRDAAIADRGGIVLNTDTIKQAIRTRAARAQLLSDFLDTGHCWERQDGLIWVLRTSAYKKFGKSQDASLNLRGGLLTTGNANPIGVLSSFVNQLKSNKEFSADFDNPVLTDLWTEKREGEETMLFTIEMPLKKEKASTLDGTKR